MATRRSASPATPPELSGSSWRATWGIPLPRVLGADGRREEHAVDRRGEPHSQLEASTARPHARVPAAPRLRPAAVRPHGHATCPSACKELDDACAPLLDAANETRREGVGGERVWPLRRDAAGLPQPRAAEAGLLEVRRGPFGEQLDLYGSRAFAVCDHQLAHVYVRAPGRRIATCATRSQRSPAWPGSSPARSGRRFISITSVRARSWCSPSRMPGSPTRSGSTTASRPDYARAVAIHHKPGFDPCELFFDPRLCVPETPRGAAADPEEARLPHDDGCGAAGRERLCGAATACAAADPLDRPILIGHGPNPGPSVPMIAVRDLLLDALELNQ